MFFLVSIEVLTPFQAVRLEGKGPLIRRSVHQGDCLNIQTHLAAPACDLHIFALPLLIASSALLPALEAHCRYRFNSAVYDMPFRLRTQRPCCFIVSPVRFDPMLYRSLNEERFIMLPTEVLAVKRLLHRPAVHHGWLPCWLYSGTEADCGLAHQHRRFIMDRLGFDDRLETESASDRRHFDHVPSVRLKALGGIILEPVLNFAVDRDSIIIIEGDEFEFHTRQGRRPRG